MSRKRRPQPQPPPRRIEADPSASLSYAPPITGFGAEAPWHERRLWEITPVRDAFWIVVTVGVAVLALWVGYALRAIFTPVLIALALAYLFDPIITGAERKRNVPRPVSIVFLLAALALSLVGFLAWLGPKLFDQARELFRNAPGHLRDLAARFNFKLDEATMAPLNQLAEDPAKFLMGAADALFGGAGHALGFISNALGKTTLLAVTLALIPLYFFFFAWQFGPLTRYFKQYIPRSRRERTLQVIGRMDAIVATYFRSRVVIALLMGVMFSVGWAWAGVPYWLLLGMGSGMLSLVPFASVVGWPLAVGLKWLAVSQGGDDAGFDVWAVVVWPSAVYLIVQFIESWVLTPLIQGRSLEMSPVTILIVVFIGGAVGGVYGLLLCVPLAACIKVLLAEIVLPRVHEWAAVN